MLDASLTAITPPDRINTRRRVPANDPRRLAGTDGRTTQGRRFRDLVLSLADQLGGVDRLSGAQFCLVRAAAALDARILRPLHWFGMLEHRREATPGDRFGGRHFYRKSPFFDRFLRFDVPVERESAVLN